MYDREPFKYYFFLHFEWIALISGLLLMAMMDPMNQASSLCLIDWLGFEFCPGCGLGTSISFAARGELSASLNAHPLGLLAVVIILGRVGEIFRRNYKYNKKEKNEKNI